MDGINLCLQGNMMFQCLITLIMFSRKLSSDTFTKVEKKKCPDAETCVQSIAFRSKVGC